MWQQAFRHQIAEYPTILQVAGVADEQAGGRRQRIDPVKEQREGGGGGWGWRVDASADHDLRRGLTRQLLGKQLEEWHHYRSILCLCAYFVLCVRLGVVWCCVWSLSLAVAASIEAGEFLCFCALANPPPRTPTPSLPQHQLDQAYGEGVGGLV